MKRKKKHIFSDIIRYILVLQGVIKVLQLCKNKNSPPSKVVSGAAICYIWLHFREQSRIWLYVTSGELQFDQCDQKIPTFGVFDLQCTDLRHFY